MSQLILNPKSFERIPEKSVYNYNFYKCIDKSCNVQTEILEKCDESGSKSTYDFYLIENDNKILLGSSEESISDAVETITIDFRFLYT